MGIDENENGRGNRLSRGEKKSALGRLTGMPESYPIPGKPSDWLKKEGKMIEKDVEVILDKSAGNFRSCPKEETKIG